MKRAKLLMAIFIIAIMISSVIGFVSLDKNNNPKNYEYKGYKFNLDANGRYIYNNFIFDYPPSDLQDIKLPDFTLEKERYYLLINYSEKDENIDYGLNKLGYNLNLAGIRSVIACINELNCPQELPAKDCNEDAFYFIKSSINQVYLQDKCVIIEGDLTGINKFVDKIDLRIAKIE